MTDTATDFWTFATRLYGEPGIAPLCLDLQDRHGVDVMMLLFCLWLGYCHGHLAPQDVDALRREGERWQRKFTMPLRQLRRRAKRLPDSVDGQQLYSALKDCELAAEAAEGHVLAQAWLRQPAPSPPAGEHAARANAHHYLAGRTTDGDSVLEPLFATARNKLATD